MGCFGQCNCGCCLSESEIAEIADTVDIEFPNDFVTNHEFTNSGCCWSASRLTGYTGFSYATPYLVQTSQIDESAQVSVKITESQKIAASGVSVVPSLEGHCLMQVEETIPTEDYCSTEINCGTVLKTGQAISKVYGTIGFRTEEIKVAIHKELMICESGGPTECRYIVECAVRFAVIIGGYLYSSSTYTTDFSNEFTCCERLNCGTEKPAHDTDHGDDPTHPDWSYGEPQNVWVLRYKTYDSIGDIPSEITFTDSDINACTTARCLEGGQLVLYEFPAEPFDVEGNELVTVSIDYYCLHCLDLGIVCRPTLDNKPCSRFPNPPYPCDCEDNDERMDANNLSISGGVGLPQATTFNAIVGNFAGLVSGSPCHRLTPVNFEASIFECTGNINNPGKCYLAATQNFQGTYPGVDLADRNICNWWDCQDCYFSGADPVVPPFQSKFSTVDSYSFDHTFTPGTGGGISLVFPTVVIRFNP